MLPTDTETEDMERDELDEDARSQTAPSTHGVPAPTPRPTLDAKLRAQALLKDPATLTAALTQLWLKHGQPQDRAEQYARTRQAPHWSGQGTVAWFGDSEQLALMIEHGCLPAEEETPSQPAVPTPTREPVPAVERVPGPEPIVTLPVEEAPKPAKTPRHPSDPPSWPRAKGPRVKSWGDLARVLKCANTDTTVQLQDFRVLVEIAAHANPKKLHGQVIKGSEWEAWPSLKGMGDRLGMWKHNVAQSMRRLVKAGYLSRVRRDTRTSPNLRVHSNLYGFHLPTLQPGELRQPRRRG